MFPCQFLAERKYRVINAGHEIVHTREPIHALSQRPDDRVLLPTCRDCGFCDMFGPNAGDRRGRDNAPKTDFNCLKIVVPSRDKPNGEIILGGLSGRG